ncbi:MAG: cystathionine gamma-synthase [Actinomycetota bacterium]|nr:cystathionine gamma-synthase [Actinomycetota bacterium]
MDYEFETRAIHAGQSPDETTGAVVPPVHFTSTYAQDEVGVHKGYEYSRSGNPTRTVLERCLASLEGVRHGLAFSSGLAASDAFLRAALNPGDHILIPDDAYGGTYRLVAKLYEPAGFAYTPVDLSDLAVLDKAWRDETKAVWLETPTNPMLKICDIQAVAALCHGRGALLIVDNTFATPYLQQPVALGADVVIHSTTKYLGGHSDVVGGFLGLNNDELRDRIAFVQNAAGAVPGPMDCYLVVRGAKTLAVRMDRHCLNAGRIAEMLSSENSVERVLYPGLATHPGHDLARRQMRGFGGMVSFIHAGGEEAAVKMCARTKVFTLAESLGAVESLIEHPARMTHASAEGSPLAVDPALVRLSVGIENVDDLIADLRGALDS